MKYYHVRIYTKQDPDGWEWIGDLSRKKLEELVISPYRVGEPITIGGKVTRFEDLIKLKIKETDGPWTITHDAAADVTDEFITGSSGTKTDNGAGVGKNSRPQPDTRRVFVVHGRNDKAREAMFSFLRSIDLDPVEWAEAVTATGSPTPYIGDILDAAFSRAHAVVVLFTPDDVACLREPFRMDIDRQHEVELTGQARPNVLFEAGMAMGRDSNRTVLVALGPLRPFSDIEGLHLIRLDDSTEQRQQLAQRLQIAGCPVKLANTQWHTEGDFAAALELAQASSHSLQSDFAHAAHRDSKAVGESVYERDDQAFINAVTDFADA